MLPCGTFSAAGSGRSGGGAAESARRSGLRRECSGPRRGGAPEWNEHLCRRRAAAGLGRSPAERGTRVGEGTRVGGEGGEKERF